jgi:hypothetical protein
MNQPIRALLIKRALLPSWSWAPGSPGLLVLLGSRFSWAPGSPGLLVLLGSWFSWAPGSPGLPVLLGSWAPGSPGLLAKVTKVTKVTCESYIKKLHIKVTFNACVIMQGMI